MTQRLRPSYLVVPLLAGLALQSPASAQAQDTGGAGSKTEALQIGEAQTEVRTRKDQGSAYLDDGAVRPAPRPAPAPPGGQIMPGEGPGVPTPQITARGQGGPGVLQLSQVELEATLAQLSPAERRVLLQAIAGTDICDNPPEVAAIVTLCQNRLETRSAEFASLAESPLSAEEQLMRGDLASRALPSLGQVIERLARGTAATNDLSNQEIASIALAGPVIAATKPDDPQPDAQSLSEESQALINALINQLGGRAP